MATRTIADGGGNYGDDSTWVEGSAPTAADDVVATATSGNLTIAATAACRSADFTGYLGLLTFTAAVTWTIGTTSANGTTALKLVPTMTTNFGAAGTVQFQDASSTPGLTITTAGKTLGKVTMNSTGGDYVMQDALTMSSTLVLTRGHLHTNNFALSCANITAGGTNTRALSLGSSAVTISAGTTSAWGFSTTTNLTFDAGTSTITLTGATQTFAGGGLTYNNVVLSGVGPYIISGANTFAALTATSSAAAAAKTLTFPAATTTTSTTLTLAGRAGGLLTIQSSSAGSAATLSVAAGTVRFNHTSVKDITGAGGATFQAYDSINVSGNTDVTFVGAKAMSLAGVG